MSAPRSVTVRDVARLARVSPATVSNVLRDHPRVAPATRERVLAAVASLDYQPNPHARSLRVGRSRTIGLVVPGLRNAYFAELAGFVIAAAKEHSLGVSLEILEDLDAEAERALLTRPDGTLIDGLIYYPHHLRGAQIDEAVRPGLPLVLIGERGAGSSFDCIEYQNVEASRAMVRHLLDRGCRRVLAIGPHENQGSATPRLEGYLAAHRDLGIPVHEELILGSRRWHRSDGTRAVAAMIAAAMPFDGIFAFNDMLAFGAMRALAEAGMRVPDDVAVAGFDDLEEAEFSLPSLTSVDPGKQQAARLAVELLEARITGQDTPHGTTTCDFSISVRASTARRRGPLGGD